jgi:hypothetical protein
MYAACMHVQGSILGPLPFVLYASDLPACRESTLGTFADDTAIFATHEDPTIASLNLQEQLHIIKKWLKKWKIKVNKSKSLYITFTPATALQLTSTKLSYLRQT